MKIMRILIVRILIVAALSGITASRAAVRPASISPSQSFRESTLQPGVFAATLDDASDGYATADPRGGVPVSSIGGFDIPSPVVRDGDLLYVGNTADNNAKLVTVVDISTYGDEEVVDSFDTPANPVDLAVDSGMVYVIDQERTPLFYRPLDESEWSSLDLPNAKVTEWTYGDIIYPVDDQILVIHMWENLIDVVDRNTHTVVHVIDELEYLPNRIVFAEDKMIVLGVGLSAPSCLATGPNFSVFQLPGYEKLYQKNITGDCALTVAYLNGRIYVAYNTKVESFDLESGELIDSIALNNVARQMETDGTSIILQRSTGAVNKIDADLSTPGESAFLLEGPQVWFPPLEEMVALDADDGRLFVTNRNDDSLSIVYFTPEATPCDGDVNGDDVVDPLDSGYVLSRLGCPVGTGDDDCDAADANADGVVDPLDVGYIASRFGNCE